MTNRLFALTFDCADAAELGGFWPHALGRELDPGLRGRSSPPSDSKTPARPSRAGASTRRRTGCTRT
jgi:hypothetical protein